MPIQKKKVPLEEVEEWNRDDVNKWLISMKLEQFQDQFEADGITGYELLRITADDIKAMNCADKKKKAMKKAIGTLDGNSISKKTKSKKESKDKPKAAPVQYNQQEAPSLPDPRSRNLSGAGPAPPLPPSSSRPAFRHQQHPQHLQQRQPLPPPARVSRTPEDDLYDDPGMTAFDYETSVVGQHFSPAERSQEMGGDGYVPQDPSDIYDCVDEVEGNLEPPPPLGARPPPILPPQGNGYRQAAASYEIEQDIYIEGGEGDEELADNSFDDLSNESEDDYISPYEEDDEELQAGAATDEGQPRVEPVQDIRMLKGKFFAHGLTKHTGLDHMGSLSARPTDGRSSINEELPPLGEEADEGDIYDIVPDEFKEEYQGAMDDEDEGEIYDIPPDTDTGGEDPQPSPAWSLPQSIKLPPKPKLSAPIPSQQAPLPNLPYRKPPPPALPPSHTNGMEEEEREDFYDEGAGEDLGYMEDVYDIPEVIDERAQLVSSVAHSAPTPSPLMSSSPLLHGGEEEEEDIYDIGEQDMEEQQAPSLPIPPLPARPSKSGNVSSSFSSMKKLPPTSSSLSTSRSPFSKPAMTNRPYGSMPPATDPPMSSSLSPPFSSSPKLRSQLPAKPPPPPLHPAEVEVPSPSPVPTLANTKPISNKSRPPPLSKFKSLGSSTKSPPFPFTSSVDKTSETSGTSASFLNAVKLKGVPGKEKSVMGKSEADIKDSAIAKPPVSGSVSKQFPTSPGGSGGGAGRTRMQSSSLNKPSTSIKISKISNLMKQFETKGGAGSEENEECEELATSSFGAPSKAPGPILAMSSNKAASIISPLSGRKIDRKSSVEDLTKKFGGNTRSPSPDNNAFLHTSGNNLPSLPAKPSSRSPSSMPMPKKMIGEKPPLPSVAKEELRVKDEEEVDDRPPNVPPPATPITKKMAGRSMERKETGPPTSRLPPKKTIVGGKPPPADREEAKPVPPWLKKSTEKEEAKPVPPWVKKSAEKEEAKPVPPWVKKSAEKEEAKPVPPWLKKSAEKEERPKPPMETSAGVKAWKKEPPPKLPNEPPRKRSSASEPLLQDTSPVPSSPKHFAYRPYSSKDRSVSNSETSAKDIPNSESQGRAPSLPDRNPPPGYRAPVMPKEKVSSVSSRNPPDAVPNRNPPSLYKPPPLEPENSVHSLPNKILSSHRPPPEPDNSVPSLPSRNPPLCRPPSELENVAPNLPSRNPPSHRQPPEPKKIPQGLPSRNRQPPESENSVPSLPSRNQLSQRPPSESENSGPSLPSRNPPSHRPPSEPENLVPSLPSRNPPSHRPPSEPENSAPGLPGRNPPLPRQPSEPQGFGPPSLPSRNSVSSRPADAGRPPRMLPSSTASHPPASDLPSTKPPDIPKRVPDPIPTGVEPPLPMRPSRNVSGTSPSNESWYHANLDRKRAEAILKRYSKDGTFIVRDSTKVIGEYSVSLWFGGGIRHLRIRLRADKKFVLGEEKSDENIFETVMDLVEHHKREPLHLKSGGETTLKFECPR